MAQKTRSDFFFFPTNYCHSEKQEAGNKTPCNFRMFHYRGPSMCTSLSLVEAGLAGRYKDATTLPSGRHRLQARTVILKLLGWSHAGRTLGWGCKLWTLQWEEVWVRASDRGHFWPRSSRKRENTTSKQRGIEQTKENMKIVRNMTTHRCTLPPPRLCE